MRHRIWLITDLRKWGLSNATVWAMVLAAGIEDQPHSWQLLFDPAGSAEPVRWPARPRQRQGRR